MTKTLQRPSGAWRGHYASLWLLILTVGFVGVTVTGFGFRLFGAWTGGLGTIVLGAIAVRRVHAFRRVASAVPAVLGLSVLALGLLATLRPGVGLDTQVPARLFASQLLLLGLTIEDLRPRTDWTRAMVPASGHLAVAAGAVVVAGTRGPLPFPALVLVVVGFALLLLEAFWAHRRSSYTEGLAAWESGFLVVLSGLLASVGIAALVQGGIPSGGLLSDLSLAVIHASVLFGVAILSGPPGPFGSRYGDRSGSLSELLASAGVFIVIVYAILFVVVLSARWIATPAFWVLIAWLSLLVLLEYAATVHGLRTPGRKATAPEVDFEPVTVVVAARDQADMLEESVRENLEVEAPLSFLLVPASSSTDGTVETAKRLAERYPERVRVEVGTGGSKAADLNQAWPLVDTDLVLVLDADEAVDVASLRWGMHRFSEDPRIGVVQGRKKRRGDARGWWDGFIEAERRYCTLLEHRFQGDVFDAAYVDGSGALLRREVPASVGGWDTTMLTGDVDFSLRLTGGSDWRIAYEPRLAVWGSRPRGIWAFLHERGRWARGWVQVATRHLPSIMAGPSGLSPRQRLGWGWRTLTAVSAPWSMLVPFLGFLWLIGQWPAISPSLALLLTVLALPSRGFAYLFAYYQDPLAEGDPTLQGGLRVLAFAYLWVLIGWLVQLQALYVEAATSPTIWQPTRSPEEPEPA